MRVASYPYSAAHKRQHANLIAMVKEYLQRYEQDADASSYDLILLYYFFKEVADRARHAR
jgi:hemerythrin